MTNQAWRKIRAVSMGAVAAITVVFVFDLLQPPPVTAEVVERHDTSGETQRVTIEWTDENDVTHTTHIWVSPEFAGQETIPVVGRGNRAMYVHDGWISLGTYLIAGVIGMTLTWFAISLRRQPYEESPIREVTPGAGA